MADTGKTGRWRGADRTVILSPTGFEPYEDKKARIDALLAEGERAEKEDW